MNKKEKGKLEKFLKTYFKEIHKIYTGGDFREETFYPALKDLFEECYKLLQKNGEANVLVLPRKTEVGIPDFRIGKNGEIIGYIEAKPPDINLKNVENSEQLKRYRTSLPNLILTNFLEFRLYRHGKPIHKVEVGRQFTLQSLKSPPTPEKLDFFVKLLQKLFSFSIPKIQNSSDLSVELAKRTRFLEHIIQEELSGKNEEVTRFYRAFKEELIEGLTEKRFADFYAQTVTYGLFSARMAIRNGFKREDAWRFIPKSLPLLKEIFYSMTGPHFPESLIWIVDEISQVLKKADISTILKEFKLTRWQEDPVIHFYETFLATYNPEERKKLGVYYTPLPVVSYIVRSIHKLLKDKFAKSEGFATNDVTLLDPAAGTLTFLVQAIKQVQEELKQKKKQGLIKSYIEEHIIPHFYAFEILVAPYTVGHFKASMILEEMGYKFKQGERLKFYLTNTLEMKEPQELSFLIELAKEGEEAKKIKEEVPILIVLGNPPYSKSSENKSEFIEDLMDDYKEDVRGERNIQPLSNDYIKFIRFAHWKIEQAGKGVLGFITNNSYLSGVIHRGMRKKLLEAFDEIYIVNLHGSSRIGEKTPAGGKDENVFDIQQGVAIAIYIKLKTPSKKKNVYYGDLWGLRAVKYDYLFKNDVKTTKWQEIDVDKFENKFLKTRWAKKYKTGFYFFTPKSAKNIIKYGNFWGIDEIFEKGSSGIKTHRDPFVVGFTKKEIIQRLRIFTGPLPDELVKQSLNLEDTGTWNLSKARQRIKNKKLENEIYPYAYRVFDNRWICYEPALIDRERWPFMKHLLNEDLTLAATRTLSKTPFAHVFISNILADICLNSNETKETTYFFPLYLSPEVSKSDNAGGANGQKSYIQRMMVFEQKTHYRNRESNLKPEFVKSLAKSYGREPTSEEIFYYIYAVLYSPTYRKQYEEFLKIDFPRVPLVPDYKVFKKLSKLGNELVELHLLKSPILDKTGISFPQGGSNTVEKLFYDDKHKRVFINNEQHFEGILKELWEYQIGAYQVMSKYLKDRKNRKLSLNEINHYMKVAKAIQQTMKIQSKIDEIFPK